MSSVSPETCTVADIEGTKKKGLTSKFVQGGGYQVDQKSMKGAGEGMAHVSVKIRNSLL